MSQTNGCFHEQGIFCFFSLHFWLFVLFSLVLGCSFFNLKYYHPAQIWTGLHPHINDTELTVKKKLNNRQWRGKNKVTEKQLCTSYVFSE